MEKEREHGDMETETTEEDNSLIGDTIETEETTTEGVISIKDGPASDGVTEEKLPVEDGDTSEPQENSANVLPAANSDTTSLEPAVNLEEVNEEHEESIVLDPETLPRKAVSPSLEEEEKEEEEEEKKEEEEEKEKEEEEKEEEEEEKKEEEEEKEEKKEEEEEEKEEEEEEGGERDNQGATPDAETEDDRYLGCVQLLQELQEEKERASQHSGELQTKLAEYLRRKAGEEGRPEGESERGRGRTPTLLKQEYQRCTEVLVDLKQQLARVRETAQKEEQELSLQTQEKLSQVENEWRALVLLKRDVAMAALSRRLGKKASKARVASSLAAEQLQQDELSELRLRHIKLRMRIRRLDAELHREEGDEEEEGRDPLLVQFELLQAARLQQKRQAEKQNEECSKLQRKVSSCLEHLTNVKQKLQESQLDVHAARSQLAEVEAALARRRDVLTGTKQARNRLQRDNVRLKEQRGLLGNRVLLRDLENTVDASERLEEQLENLMSRRAEIGYRCGRWRKKLGPTE